MFPCITLRESTEWLETVELKANTLVGTENDRIVREAKTLLGDRTLKKRLATVPNPYGDGRAADKICGTLKDMFYSGKIKIGYWKPGWKHSVRGTSRK